MLAGFANNELASKADDSSNHISVISLSDSKNAVLNSSNYKFTYKYILNRMDVFHVQKRMIYNSSVSNEYYSIFTSSGAKLCIIFRIGSWQGSCALNRSLVNRFVVSTLISVYAKLTIKWLPVTASNA